jgi:quinol---cytochrome-c reductase cytochrome c subunit
MSGPGRILLAASLAGMALMYVELSRAGPGALGQTATPTPSATLASVPTAAPTPTSGHGRDLYLRDCAWCHGAQGEGSIYGPSLVGVGAASADFMLSTGRMPIPNAEEQPQRAPVPYPPQDIRDLVGFVAALGSGPPIPSVSAQSGDLGEGAELYQENCAACHGAIGSGGALTNGLLAPGLGRSTPVQVAEAIRLGGAGLRSGNMPRYGRETLTDQQVDSIAGYVAYLRRPEDRGGAPLGHFGPIPEGAVTWLVGLFGLILLTRWIGTTR